MHPRPRHHYILRRSENRFALKKLYDAHNPRSSFKTKNYPSYIT